MRRIGLVVSILSFLISIELNAQNVSVNLTQNWKFHKAGEKEWLAATVPGTVHTDLLRNKKIPDPYYRFNEKEVQWIENEQWEYATTFPVSSNVLDKDFVELEFEGLDTYADVFLNDSKILATDNMFRSYKVDVKKNLRQGDNKLSILFRSPVKVGLDKLKKSPHLLPATNEQAPLEERTNIYTRKAPYHYGWDWGPRLVTSGIWRPIHLNAWNNARIKDVYHEQSAFSKNYAKYRSSIDVEGGKGSYTIQVFLDTKQVAEQSVTLGGHSKPISIPLEIIKPKLWWCNGMGEPYLYKVKYILSQDKKPIDTLQLDLGVRTLELVQELDSAGRSFYFKLNGLPVYMKGTNYIPNDMFIPRISHKDIDKLMDAMKDANMNMVRVWGGAIYESDYFYSQCDKKGLLVWQDFMFACSMPPGDTAHLSNIEAEAEEQVKRLRNHASLALWCGNNENLMSMYGWEWSKVYKQSPADSLQMWNVYNKIFNQLLPQTVQKLDFKTPYWPCSPSNYGYNKFDKEKSGDTHDWVIWFAREPFRTYRWTHGRFTSEYGMQSYPEMRTIKAFSTKEDWAYDSPQMDFRQRSRMENFGKGYSGNDLIRDYILMYYKEPKNFESFVYHSQVMQAEGLKAGIEAHRMKKPYNMGSLYWQINDCWPTISWATIDYFYRWKIGHYFVKKAFEETIVASYVEKDTLDVFLVSDKVTPINGVMKYIVKDFSGKILYSSEEKATTNFYKSLKVAAIPVATLVKGGSSNRAFAQLQFWSEGKLVSENIQYFVAPKELSLDKADIQKRVFLKDGRYTIELSTSRLVKNLRLDTKGELEGFFSDNGFDLLPNEKKMITWTTDKSITAKNLESSLIFTSINDAK